VNLSKPCPARPDLAELLAKSASAYAKMAPAQQQKMQLAQRKSWVVGETMLAHPEMTRDEAVALFERVCP
jgi:hypothetical protein